MPLFKKFRSETYRKQEEKIKRQQDQLIKDGVRSKKDAENRDKLHAYNLQRKEKELADEAIKLGRKQEAARQQAADREEEKRRKDAAFQAILAREAAEELEQTKRNYDEKIRQLEAFQSRNDYESQMRLAGERRQREEVTAQLRREREAVEKARRDEEVRQQRVKEKRDAERRDAERQRQEEERNILQAEKNRQREQLIHHNSASALQELRDLIRERYELDMEIYRLRKISVSNQHLVKQRMDRADEILQKIHSIVEVWSAESFNEIEWAIAEQIKERLLAGGKRIWATDPPWDTYTKSGLPPPPGSRLSSRGGPPPPRRRGLPSSTGERRVVSGSRVGMI